jgi:enoyl-CoA hydratase/carnithine racemase
VDRDDLILISVDDHVIEPPDTFAGRLPGKYADDALMVVPADQVLAAAIGLAERIAQNAPLALFMTKRLSRERRRGTAEETHSVLGSADAREGAVAFAEKRTAVWTAR